MHVCMYACIYKCIYVRIDTDMHTWQLRESLQVFPIHFQVDRVKFGRHDALCGRRFLAHQTRIQSLLELQRQLPETHLAKK